MQDSTGSGKGSEPRPVNKKKYDSEFDRIFGAGKNSAQKILDDKPNLPTITPKNPEKLKRFIKKRLKTGSATTQEIINDQ